MFRLNREEVGKTIWIPLDSTQKIYECKFLFTHRDGYHILVDTESVNNKYFAYSTLDRTVSFDIRCPQKTLARTMKNIRKLTSTEKFYSSESGFDENHKYVENYRILRAIRKANSTPVKQNKLVKCMITGRCMRENDQCAVRFVGGWVHRYAYNNSNARVSAISGKLMLISQSVAVDGGTGYVHESELGDCEECPNCGELSAGLRDVDGEMFCGACIEENTMRCSRCGDLHLTSNMTDMDNGDCYCDDCIESADVCDVCGELYYEGGDNYDEFHSCDECYKENISGYSTKFTDLEDYKDRLMFGIEMEFECDTNRVLAAKRVKEKFGDIIMVKYDGSLDYGIEVVTRPMQLKEVIETAKGIADFMDGYSKHSPDGTGIHVHVNREHLSVEDISKMIYVFSELSESVEEIAQRDTEEWAEICPVSKEEVAYAYDVLGKNSDTRRRAINTTNKKTIEFRIFQGGVPSSDVEAYLLFLDLLIKSVKSCDVLSMNSISFYSLFEPYMGEAMYQPLFKYLVNVGVFPKEERKELVEAFNNN